jgi:hypothetical protein
MTCTTRRIAGLRYRTCVFDSETSIRVYRPHDPHPIASITLNPRSEHGVKVGLVHLHGAEPRQRVGTTLYELAAAIACRMGKPLVSDDLRSPYAEAFWRKQARLRRAVCATKAQRGGLYRMISAPLVGPGLPAAKVHDVSGAYWPCGRWEMKPSICRKKRRPNLRGL